MRLEEFDGKKGERKFDGKKGDEEVRRRFLQQYIGKFQEVRGREVLENVAKYLKLSMPGAPA